MPEYDEKLDYVIDEDYNEPIHEDDKWVLIEDMKNFQSFVNDFMLSPVSSEKDIRINQMNNDMKELSSDYHGHEHD